MSARHSAQLGRTGTSLPSAHLELDVKSSGRRVDLRIPFVDAALPDGHRLHTPAWGAVMGGTTWTESATASRRSLPSEARSVDELDSETRSRCGGPEVRQRHDAGST
jgi:hypothetical protein